MPKTYQWKTFSLAELRKVGRAYKDHTEVGSVSKMSKKELLVLLDKHLVLDKNTAEIKPRKSMESSSGAIEKMDKPKKSKMPPAPPSASPSRASSPEPMSPTEAMELAKMAMDIIHNSMKSGYTKKY